MLLPNSIAFRLLTHNCNCNISPTKLVLLSFLTLLDCLVIAIRSCLFSIAVASSWLLGRMLLAVALATTTSSFYPAVVNLFFFFFVTFNEFALYSAAFPIMLELDTILDGFIACSLFR